MLGGVSRVLDVKYVRALRVGEEVVVETEVVHVGRQAAAIRGVIRDGGGRVCSTCEHDKTNIDPPLEEKAKL
jgi:acyl-coenzyme A thioesterase 13